MESIEAMPIYSEPEDRFQMGSLVTSIVTLLDAAKAERKNNREAAWASVDRASSLLRVEMARRHSKRSDRGMPAWQIRRVIDYIDSHIGGTILVLDLSDLLQRSEAHFARTFKKSLGEAPHAYIIRRRVEHAKHLMLTTEMPLSEIALACGFTDQAHICKSFRAHVGQSPAAWRRERCETLVNHRDVAETRAVITPAFRETPTDMFGASR